VKVKICGITNLDDALLCAEAGADALGFIFYDKSKRYIEPERASSIISELPALLMKVGVFVNEDPGRVNDIAELTGLNTVQLHGEEDVHYIEKIIFPVIKAFRVEKKFDYASLESYKYCGWLLDTFNNEEYGGTGESFKWSSIPEKVRSKVVLAGGIGIENIEEAYRIVKPAAVDLSSSLESSPGKKDKMKITVFMNKVKELRGF
jgi:phosphoribosylanthranilate isomerase